MCIFEVESGDAVVVKRSQIHVFTLSTATIMFRFIALRASRLAAPTARHARIAASAVHAHQLLLHTSASVWQGDAAAAAAPDKGELRTMTAGHTILEPTVGQGKAFDLDAIVESVEEEWHNQTLCDVNDSWVRMGIFRGMFHWHVHDVEDEFFFVVDGTLILDIRDSDNGKETRHLLTKNQGYTVSKRQAKAQISTAISRLLCV